MLNSSFRNLLWILLAVFAAFIGFVAWAFLYYRPTLEYAYTDINLTRPMLLATVGLLVLGLIIWKVFKK